MTSALVIIDKAKRRGFTIVDIVRATGMQHKRLTHLARGIGRDPTDAEVAALARFDRDALRQAAPSARP